MTLRTIVVPAALAVLMIALATAPASAGTQSASARSRARAIVSEKRFRAASFPRPLHRFFARVGELLRRLVDSIAAHVPGGPAVVWSLLGALVVAVAAVGGSRSVRRRVANAAVPSASPAAGALGEDAAALERAGDEAESAGEFERAVRLRFRAGLLRLDASRVIDLRPSLTTHEAARSIDSPRFDRLALTFEEVAYGGRRADVEDAAEARSEWPDVLAECAGR